MCNHHHLPHSELFFILQTFFKNKLCELHISFHSLETCFCFSLLLRVIILEDELEKLVCTKETQELVSEAYQILEQKLKLIQPHVQASNNCWEEAISQVDKLLRRNTDKKGTYERVLSHTLTRHTYSPVGLHQVYFLSV